MDDRRRHSLVELGFLAEGGVGVLAVVVGGLIGYPVGDRLRWDLADAVAGVCLTVPLLLSFFLMVRWPIGPLARIKEFSDEVIRPLFGRCSVTDLALLSLLAGIGEETCFRGLLQPVLSDGFGTWTGLVLAAMLFGLFHLITPTYAMLATLVGMYLGWCFLATENLLAPMVSHAVYDFVALVYLTRRST
jgi:hypothetical protein